ncbi:MAG TPA: pyridoxamine 5'-phosphate oxidase family protein [Thermomicrobiales bacterium]|nr:pyridoxamine 5'-phosphate oxidase family protein [Thermomicrobiales bacterium]
MSTAWGSFESSARPLAAAGHRLMHATGIAFLATVRRDGSPRLHPVVPIFAGDGLYVFVSHASPKRHDLTRDGRFALHASLGPDDEEFVITGFVARVDDADQRARVQSAAAHAIHDGDILFEFRIERCLHTVWERVGQPDTNPLRTRWAVSDH